MTLHDSHIHVGQFRNLYTTPESVCEFLAKNGVDKFAVSSSSTINKDYKIALEEMHKIVEIGGDRVIPVLWINPEWIENKVFDEMLNSGIEWKCLKIHGYFSPWENYSNQLGVVVNKARELNVPLLFHTGGRSESDSASYLNIIKQNPDVTFILAHSRPVDQAMLVMKECENALADTAFTPIEDIEQMIHAGLSGRMLWGTDYPLHNVFYKGQDVGAILTDKLENLRRITTPIQFENITFKNFEKVF